MIDSTNQTEPPTELDLGMWFGQSHYKVYAVDADGQVWIMTDTHGVDELPEDAVRLTPQDQPGEILRLQADISELRRDLAAERPRANDAARLAADARDELDRVREELADTKEHLGLIDTDRTVQDVKLEDQAAELSRLRADMRIRQGALADALGVPRHEDPASYYANIEAVSILRRELGQLRLAQARDQTGTATLEVDDDTGPWYLRLLHEPVARTSEPGCLVHIDWARDGRMIGVEILPDQTATPSDLQVPPSLGANHAGTGDTATLAQTFPFGEFLDGELTARKIPRRMLRRALGLSLSEIDDLIEGRRELTRDLADRLGRFLGTSAELWLNLDRIHKAAHRPGDTAQPDDEVELLRADGRELRGRVLRARLTLDDFMAGRYSTPEEGRELLDKVHVALIDIPAIREAHAGLLAARPDTPTEPAPAPGDAPTHAGLLRDARHVGHAGPIDQCPLCKPTRQDTEETEPMPCPRCEGCGQLANSDDREPWTTWENLPPGSDLAVQLGLVRPVPCDDCAGTGKRPAASEETR